MATEGSSSPSEEEVRETVLQILQEADLENTTEFKVRSRASEKLGADLNQPFYKKLVRKVVGDYLNTRAEAETEPEPQEVGEEEEAAAGDQPPSAGDAPRRDSGSKAGNESGEDEEDEAQPSRFARKPAPPPPKQMKIASGNDEDNVICQLSSKRHVSIQKFRGRTLVSIREYYEKDGELRPSAKGISLTVEQWQVLRKNISAIEKAIEEIQ